MAIDASAFGRSWDLWTGLQRGNLGVQLVGGGKGGMICGFLLCQMICRGLCAVGDYRHTRERWQVCVGVWTESVGGFAYARSSHSPTSEFHMSKQV